MQLSLDLPQSLLELSLLLASAVFIGLLARRINIPLTVVLAIGGFLVTWAGADLALMDLLRGEGFEQILVNLFLPILIFEAALSLVTREFMRNLLAIVALATVALVIAAALVGVTLHLGLGIGFTSALLFGVVISATDPVAVVALFRELGVSDRLLTLVEGESLLNDAVAIVLSGILVLAALGHGLSVGTGAVDFLGVFFGGALIGGLIGAAAVLVLPVLHRLPAAALSVAVAYGSAVLAEAVLGFSGVMATLGAGVVVGGMVPSRASEAVRDMLTELWEALGYIANALLFLFIGLFIRPELITDNLAAIGIAIAAVLMARPLAIVPLMSVLERLAHIPRVGHRNSAVLVWGGLRGGVALALALALPPQLPERDLFVALTAGVVVATLLLNATTISTLVHLLGMDRPTRAEQYADAIASLVAVQAARSRLAKLQMQDEIVEARLNVAAAEAGEQLQHARLDPEEERRVLTLRGLHIERRTYQSLGDAGLLPPIATRTLMQEIDDEIEELDAGELRIDAARRAALPWYGGLHRRLLGLLPEPLGEDLNEVAYIEVSARRLAAQRACEELDLFKGLPTVQVTNVDEVKKTFLHWEEAAVAALERLDEGSQLNLALLRRRQAEALARIAAVEALAELAESGLMSGPATDQAAARIASELSRARS